jgi:hypothetical protein
LDYRLYKIYIWGGLASVVAYLVVTTLRMEALTLTAQYREVFPRLLAPVMIYVAGILLYWWWVFLFKGNQDLAKLGEVQGEGVPAIKALRTWPWASWWKTWASRMMLAPSTFCMARPMA